MTEVLKKQDAGKELSRQNWADESDGDEENAGEIGSDATIKVAPKQAAVPAEENKEQV
jgi:hypothetical protein